MFGTNFEPLPTEFEINYNPTRSWTIKFTAARQKVIDTNISPSVQQWLDLRLPVWLAATDDTGNSYWTFNGTNSPQARDAGSFMRTGACGSPSWRRRHSLVDRYAGYVCARPERASFNPRANGAGHTFLNV